jgi:dipeptidyl aminopeptidase/acylaminoacyl peptidase
MTRRRMLHLPALLLGTLAAAVLLACAAASLAVSEKAEATLPGKNGRIAYSAFDVGAAEAIYTINPGGGDKSKLTSGYQPSYSPDGRRIAYTAWPVFGGADAEIYTINVRGEYKTQLTHNNKDEITPDYSPDGKRIVYAGLAGLEANNAERGIYTIKAGGGGKTQITNTDNVDDLHPSYSPDGKKIVYTVWKGVATGGDIYTINVGGGRFRVTHGKADEGGPAWGSLGPSSSCPYSPKCLEEAFSEVRECAQSPSTCSSVCMRQCAGGLRSR